MAGFEVVKWSLYVGCGLTHAPKAFRQEVTDTKTALRARWDVKDFKGLGEAEPGEVYDIDIIENVGTCDAFVGIMDEPSWGLGFETAMAAAREVPIMLAHHESTRITRLATDAALRVQNLVVVQYVDMVSDVPALADQHLVPMLTRAA